MCAFKYTWIKKTHKIHKKYKYLSSFQKLYQLINELKSKFKMKVHLYQANMGTNQTIFSFLKTEFVSCWTFFPKYKRFIQTTFPPSFPTLRCYLSDYRSYYLVSKRHNIWTQLLYNRSCHQRIFYSCLTCWKGITERSS